MLTCTRKLTFCAGHRVLGHENKCGQPHGHEYKVYITAIRQNTTPEAAIPHEVDALGRVIDFAVIKEKVGAWIEANLDHGFIVFSEDGDLIKALASLSGSKIFLLPCNPTAENIAKYLLEVVCKDLFKETEVRIIRVVVQETENCSAEANYE